MLSLCDGYIEIYYILFILYIYSSFSYFRGCLKFFILSLKKKGREIKDEKERKKESREKGEERGRKERKEISFVLYM